MMAVVLPEVARGWVGGWEEGAESGSRDGNVSCACVSCSARWQAVGLGLAVGEVKGIGHIFFCHFELAVQRKSTMG